MAAAALMIQGTGSHVGKSALVTALCRVFHRRGLRVAPFKAQNMALNSYVTADGCEIGWAQAVQAQAAGLLPMADFNPILLKPTGERRSQVIVGGKPLATLSASAYEKLKPRLWQRVQEAWGRLRSSYDVVVIEGAGSPAEINLKKNDIVNMRVARLANAPVLLVSDIDRGGVFASLIGTVQLLEPWEKRLVRGLVINKFRGDPKILEPGLKMLARKSRKPVLGVLPYFNFGHQDQEDSVALEDKLQASASGNGEKIHVAVIRTPRISNFTDFDSLLLEPRVALRFVQRPEEMDSPDLLILPGSKNTMEDLAGLEQSGLYGAIREAAQKGALVLGICGGYQMLGRRIEDPAGMESGRRRMQGLGLLDVDTVFLAEKSLHQVDFSMEGGSEMFQGYEIHMGQTRRLGQTRPLFRLVKRSGQKVTDTDGAINAEGNVMGTYMHGLFANDAFRHGLLKKLAGKKGMTLRTSDLLQDFKGVREKNLDRLADWAEGNLDMCAVSRIVGI